MDEARSQDAALSLCDDGPLRRVRDPGGLESEGLTLRSGSILKSRSPHMSQISDSHTQSVQRQRTLHKLGLYRVKLCIGNLKLGEMEFGEMKRNTSNWGNFCILLSRAGLSASARLSC